MSTIGWVIVLVLVVPALGLLLWLVFAESVVRVPAGRLGLLMIKGRATDTALLPGPHFVPALRRRIGRGVSGGRARIPRRCAG